MRWQRAKAWITSPDPEYARKKDARDRLIASPGPTPQWALGFEDEVWWSRLAHPALHAWAEPDRPLRLVEQTVAKDDPDPKALACYGLLVRWWAAGRTRPPREEAWLRFVDGRPVSAVTTRFLAWGCAKLAAAGKTALLLVWDNAAWHLSKEVRALDPRAQPAGARDRARRPDRALPPARQEPLAEPHRAQVGPRQAQGRRARPPAHRPRTGRARLRRASRAPTNPHLSLMETVA